MNVKFAVASLLRHYKVKLDTSKTKYPFKMDAKEVNINPEGGFWIKMEKIWRIKFIKMLLIFIKNHKSKKKYFLTQKLL